MRLWKAHDDWLLQLLFHDKLAIHSARIYWNLYCDNTWLYKLCCFNQRCFGHIHHVYPTINSYTSPLKKLQEIHFSLEYLHSPPFLRAYRREHRLRTARAAENFRDITPGVINFGPRLIAMRDDCRGPIGARATIVRDRGEIPGILAISGTRREINSPSIVEFPPFPRGREDCFEGKRWR